MRDVRSMRPVQAMDRAGRCDGRFASGHARTGGNRGNAESALRDRADGGCRQRAPQTAAPISVDGRSKSSRAGANLRCRSSDDPTRLGRAWTVERPKVVRPRSPTVGGCSRRPTWRLSCASTSICSTLTACGLVTRSPASHGWSRGGRPGDRPETSRRTSGCQLSRSAAQHGRV